MKGRRRLAGARLDGNQAGRSNSKESVGKPAPTF